MLDNLAANFYDWMQIAAVCYPTAYEKEFAVPHRYPRGINPSIYQSGEQRAISIALDRGGVRRAFPLIP